MASYNGEKYIKEQIDSILIQLTGVDELIISDDNSTDDTEKIILSYNDNRIKLLSNIHETGPKGNFETAIEQAKGEYIFLSDQDDIWFDNKISVIVPHLDKYDLVVHDACIVGKDAHSLNENYYSLFRNYSSFWGNLYKTRFLGCCMAFKKDTLKYVLPFPKRVEMHDYWIGMITSTKGKLLFVDDILIKYRRHGNNFSPSAEKSDKTILGKMKKRVDVFFDVLARCCKKSK